MTTHNDDLTTHSDDLDDLDDLDEHIKQPSKAKPKAKNKSKMKAKKARNDLEKPSTKAGPARSPKSINVNVHLFDLLVQRDSPFFSRTTLQNSCTIDKWIRRRYCLQMK